MERGDPDREPKLEDAPEEGVDASSPQPTKTIGKGSSGLGRRAGCLSRLVATVSPPRRQQSRGPRPPGLRQRFLAFSTPKSSATTCPNLCCVSPVISCRRCKATFGPRRLARWQVVCGAPAAMAALAMDSKIPRAIGRRHTRAARFRVAHQYRSPASFAFARKSPRSPDPCLQGINHCLGAEVVDIVLRDLQT